MPQKGEALMIETITQTIVVAVVEGKTRRRKRKVRIRIGSLDLGTIHSDFATVEPTHQSSLRRNAALVTRATVATICGNISKKESGQTLVRLAENAQSGRSTEHAMQDGSAASCQVIRRKLNEKMAGRNWS